MYHNINSFERFCDVVRNDSLHDTAAFPFEIKCIFEENDLNIINEKLIKIVLWADENIGVNMWNFGKTNMLAQKDGGIHVFMGPLSSIPL